MQIHDISISLLREYDNNPRNNDGAVVARIAMTMTKHCIVVQRGTNIADLSWNNTAKRSGAVRLLQGRSL